MNHSFVLGFSIFFLIFFTITTSLTTVQLDKGAEEWYVWTAGLALALGAFCNSIALWRHWRSSTAAN